MKSLSSLSINGSKTTFIYRHFCWEPSGRQSIRADAVLYCTALYLNLSLFANSRVLSRIIITRRRGNLIPFVGRQLTVSKCSTWIPQYSSLLLQYTVLVSYCTYCAKPPSSCSSLAASDSLVPIDETRLSCGETGFSPVLCPDTDAIVSCHFCASWGVCALNAYS